jgi:hypothetical protein
MSNRKHLHLAPYTRPVDYPEPTAIVAAGPGERCQYHDGCCEPDDFTCPGHCPAGAIALVRFRMPSGTERWQGFCEQHAHHVGHAVEFLVRERESGAN